LTGNSKKNQKPATAEKGENWETGGWGVKKAAIVKIIGGLGAQTNVTATLAGKTWYQMQKSLSNVTGECNVNGTSN